MSRTNYQRGADKERRIVNLFKAQGCTALRSAGSHSPIDVIAIDPKDKEIFLIQSKLRGHKNLSKKEKEKILKEGEALGGLYNVKFKLWY